MKKIGIEAHCLEGERTGVGRYLENILRQLSKLKGLEDRYHFVIYTKKEKLEDDFLQGPLFTTKCLNKSSFTVYFNFTLPLKLRREDVDFVWFPSYFAPLVVPKPFVVTLHDVVFEVEPAGIPKFYLAIYKVFCPWAAKRAEKILTVSHSAKKEIVDYYGVDSDKVQISPLATSDNFVTVEDEDVIDSAKKKYGLKEDYILYLGQIFNRRFVRESVEAFVRIADNFDQLQFFLVGTNRTVPKIKLDKIKEKVNKKMGYKAIVRLDYLPEEDMAPIMSGAEAFIYLSSYEGFGIPPLEAMACGSPVVTTDKSSLKEVIGDAAAVVKNPNQPEEIAEKLNKVLTDKEYRNSLIKKGYKRNEKFSWKKTAQKTLTALEDL